MKGQAGRKHPQVTCVTREDQTTTVQEEQKKMKTLLQRGYKAARRQREQPQTAAAAGRHDTWALQQLSKARHSPPCGPACSTSVVTPQKRSLGRFPLGDRSLRRTLAQANGRRRAGLRSPRRGRPCGAHLPTGVHTLTAHSSPSNSPKGETTKMPTDRRTVVPPPMDTTRQQAGMSDRHTAQTPQGATC